MKEAKQELIPKSSKSGTEDKRISSLTDDLSTLPDQLSLLTVAKDKHDATSHNLEESVSLQCIITALYMYVHVHVHVLVVTRYTHVHVHCIWSSLLA